MKILYAIQATGNGHIARAMELMPYLQQYGNVDVFLSGSNSNLSFNLPVTYRSKGLSLFYGKRGGLHYGKMWKELDVKRFWREAKDLPVEKYDVVINDFESITSLACKLKKVPSINFGHQASFQSKHTPRPKHKDVAGEFILKNYASANAYVGLHFEKYDDFIFSPIIKHDILNAVPRTEDYITVYLSHYADEVVAASLKNTNQNFHVFSKQRKQVSTEGNITFVPVNNTAFNASMINSTGIITGAGFETPAEALFMHKKLLCLPIKGQYEQWCNAAALQRFNVPVVKNIDANFNHTVEAWLNAPKPKQLQLTNSTFEIVQHAMHVAKALQYKNKYLLNESLLSDEDISAAF